MKRVNKDVADRMKFAVRQLKRGKTSIMECEAMLNSIVSEVAVSIDDIDERIETIKVIKRRAWRMLLDATK